MRKMKDSGIEWIGEIPEDWEVGRVKNIAELISGYAFDSEDLNIEGKNIVIRIGDIKDGSVDIENANKTNFNDEVLSFFQVKNNDVLIAMSGATVGKLGYVNFTPKNTYINQRVGILRSSFSKFLYYALTTNKFIEYILLESIGSAQPNISNDGIKNYPLCIPSLPEQQRIADFLDDKVSQIDSVISKTRETIEEYKKLKQAIITEAVTKGLNPNAKMKNSGIEWIGEIPEEWECFYLSQIFTPVKNKNIGLIENNLLSLSYGKIIRKNIETTFGLLPENFEGYNIIQENDIVLRLTDLQNDHKSLRVGIAKEKGIITSAYLTLRNQTNKIAKYFYYLLHSFDIAKGFYGMGAGVRQGLNWNEVRSLRMIAPKDISEQQQIADYLDQKCSEIDNLITKKEQLVVELEAYKKSLIYEVVTGKREV